MEAIEWLFLILFLGVPITCMFAALHKGKYYPYD